jgi:RNA polymerase sigma factor (sigma-70 family)
MSSLDQLISGLSRLADSPAAEPSDADLFDRFRAGGEEAAFALLVQRHGPAVLGVCRRVLGHAADAEDAFQATFLVLLRKADSIRRRDSLGSWLYGVAYRVASKVRGRRILTAPPSSTPAIADSDPAADVALREVTAVLDEEIQLLPDKYRAAIILCGLEGKTCEQAARELRWPKSSLAHRLTRARALLQSRLARRGIGVPAALLATVLAREAAAARLPTLLTLDTVRLAARVMSGTPAVHARAVALAQGVATETAPARWVIALALAASIGLTAAAGMLAALKEPVPQPPRAESPRGVGADGHVVRQRFALPAEALARVGSSQLRHQLLRHLEYSPDGSLLASCGGCLLRLWDAGTGKLVWQTEVVTDDLHVRSGLFTADGKTVLVFDDEACHWFDVHTGKEVRRRAITCPKGPQWHACFAPRGKMMAVAGTDPGQDLVVYDLPSGRERFRTKAENSWTFELAFSPDGKVLAAEDKMRVKLLDTATGKLLGDFGAGETVRGLAFAPDGTKLLAHCFRTDVRVWSVPAGKLLHRVEVAVNHVTQAAFTPDGTALVVGSQDLDAVLIDLTTGRERRRFRTYPSSIFFAFAPHGKTVAIGVGEGNISQWDLASGRRLASADPIAYPGQMQFTSDDKLLLLFPEALTLMDWQSHREVRRVPLAHEGTGWVMALSPDRSRVAGVNTQGNTVVWDAGSGKELCTLPTADRHMTVRAFAPDGKTLYTAAWWGPVRAWDVSTQKERPPFDNVRHFTRSLVVSPDGRWLAAADHPQVAGGPRREVTVWDLATGREPHRLLPQSTWGYTWALAFSPDNTSLAAVGGAWKLAPREKGAFITVWDVHTGKARFPGIDLDGFLVSVAFSPDGRMLATGDQDGTVRLWEAATGLERHRFAGHESTVNAVAFSPDGKLVASTSADAPIFVWDVIGCYGKPASNTPFRPDEKDVLWKSLRYADAATAFQAMRRMMARPGPALALLGQCLRPAPAVSTTTVQHLLRDLESEEFGTRQKAAAGLEDVADRAEMLLCKALQKKLSPETGRAIAYALESASPAAPPRRREARAVEVLEHIGTPEARRLLKALAGGAVEAFLTREAKASLQRLEQRPTGSP